MESLTLNVRVNANDKKEFEKFCVNVGMNTSTAINLFIKAVLREQKIPFEICNNSIENDIYTKLQEAEEEIINDEKRYTKEDIIKNIDNILDN